MVRRLVAFAGFLTALIAPLACRDAQAQALPNLDVILVVEVHDANAWRAFHAEVLGTSHQSKGLDVAITAGTGGTRGIKVTQPKFTVTLVKGAPIFKVVVTGKLNGGEALGSLGAFEQAVHENFSSPGDALVGFYYGLASVGADLIEMHVTRP